MSSLRHLIVVVPGIGGSTLADGRGVVWGDSARRLAGVMTAPERLAADQPLRVTGLMSTLGYIAPLKVPGYGKLLQGLLNGLNISGLRLDETADGKPRDLSADIVTLPYDFRLGVEPAAERLAAEVSARLSHLAPAQRVKRVIVIGHSMGGLVARCWIMAHPEQAEWCRAVLTVGTPHRGATRALDWLVNGIGFGAGLPVASGAALATTRSMLSRTTQTLRTWRGAYDLLPTYKVVEDIGGGRHLDSVELAQADGPGFAADRRFRLEATLARKQISRTVDVVIFWPGAFTDDEATWFAEEFHGHVGRRFTVSRAFAEGSAAVTSRSGSVSPPRLWDRLGGALV